MEVKIQTRQLKRKTNKRILAVRISFLLFIFQRKISSLCRLLLQIVKVWSEDGAGKVVEIPADMTARDVCQLLVYKSHCVDDAAWTLVEHHPILGLGESGASPQVAAGFNQPPLCRFKSVLAVSKCARRKQIANGKKKNSPDSPEFCRDVVGTASEQEGRLFFICFLIVCPFSCVCVCVHF